MRRAFPILLWVTLLAIAITLSLNQGRIETELSKVLPTPKNTKQQLLIDELRQGPFSRLMLLGIQGANADVIAAASKSLARKLRASGDFVLVANGEETLNDRDRDLLYDHRYLLSPAVRPAQFTASGLRDALRSRLRELSSPLSPLVRPYLSEDPTAAFRSVLEAWLNRHGPRTHDSVWLSKDGRRALLTAETKAPGFNLAAQQKLQDEIRKAFQETKRESAEFTPLQLVMTGPAVFAVKARNAVRSETAWLSSAATLLVVLFLYANYRSVLVIGLALIPLFSGMIMGVALVILVIGYVHGITLAFGATVIGVAVDYPIHLFSHLRPGISPKTTLAKIWPTMSLGVTTTVIGYFGLLFSGFPGLFELGLFAAVGLTTAAFVTRWILPEIIPATLQPSRFHPVLTRLMEGTKRYRIVVPFALGIAAVYLGFSERSVWERNIANLIPLPQQQREIDRTLREEFTAPEGRTLVVVPGQTQEKALQSIEQLEPLLEKLKSDGIVSHYDPATRYLPSQKSQRAVQRQLPDRTTLARNLDRAVEGLPFKKGVFDPFIRETARAKQQAPLVIEDFANSALGLKLRSLLFQRDAKWFGIIPVQDVSDLKEMGRVLAQSDVPGVFHLNLKQESNLIVSEYSDEALLISVWAILAICVVLFWKLREFWFLPRIVLPIVAAIVTVAGVLHAVGEPFSVFHLASMLLVMGIGLDYSLFFNRVHKTRAERDATAHAIATCVVTTALVFGTLAMSEIPVLRSIGVTVTLGSLTCFLFSCILSKRVTPATHR